MSGLLVAAAQIVGATKAARPRLRKSFGFWYRYVQPADIWIGLGATPAEAYVDWQTGRSAR